MIIVDSEVEVEGARGALEEVVKVLMMVHLDRREKEDALIVVRKVTWHGNAPMHRVLAANSKELGEAEVVEVATQLEDPSSATIAKRRVTCLKAAPIQEKSETEMTTKIEDHTKREKLMIMGLTLAQKTSSLLGKTTKVAAGTVLVMIQGSKTMTTSEQKIHLEAVAGETAEETTAASVTIKSPLRELKLEAKETVAGATRHYLRLRITMKRQEAGTEKMSSW